ncbi:hypothetical protein ISF_00746 [Cordyceps fumosorosea ARSEF 2679]|uniref:Uncharacterized protein n=1 Tax=Cordyceps fumosorosea (strain ARSEF 2679) TaxID=1081104 RepID=A0A168EIF9_CORFA|nr:hypothetical protein ISF_00746 [Cordyceps fumosorosea ARSEF 2679]OAA73845.1 hypothetical protein ISF_00746 [Cordyceps fumosorosea ARSEF 2679]
MCRPVFFICLYCGARYFFLWEECDHFWARYQKVVFEQGNWEDRPRVSRRADEPPACGGDVQHHRDREAPLGRCPRLRECPSLRPYLSQQKKQRLRTLSRSQGGGVPMTEDQIQDFFQRRRQWNYEIENFRRFRMPVPPVPPGEVEMMGRRAAEAAVVADTRWLMRRQARAAAPDDADDADDEKGEEKEQAEKEEQEAQGQPVMQSTGDPADDSGDGIPPESLLSETTVPMLPLSSNQQPTTGAE